MTRALRLLVGLALLASLLPAGASALDRGGGIKGTWITQFPEHVHGTSVAIGPEGVPWLGLSTEVQPLSVAYLGAKGPVVEELHTGATGATTASVQFDSRGALWFAIGGQVPAAIGRRDPDGTVVAFPLPLGEPVTALTVGTEGNIWFTRGGYGTSAEATVGRMTATGAVAEIPLGAGSRPTSIVAGPDGAIWFNEERGGKIGRVTTSGEVRLFDLAPKAEPRQIVAGADGALWFGESARARKYQKLSDRIGRITVDGQVSEFPVPFGVGTARLAADPRGVIWFATDEGEISSISPSGNVGPRACSAECGTGVESLALAADGTLWFAGAVPYCANCGGGSNLILMGYGTHVGRIPAGALKAADPSGPPAKDPYAHLPAHPPAPIARTEPPEKVEGTFAIFNGFVNPRGFPARWRFKWGRTKAYGHVTFFPERSLSGEYSAEVGEDLFDLCPSTTYHFELVAYGPGGRTPGGDRTFTTPSIKRTPKHCRGH